MENTTLSSTELIDACRVLFGADTIITPASLRLLPPARLKAAYRKRLWETHPDRAAQLHLSPALLEERCKEVNIAYERLCLYLSHPHGSVPEGISPPYFHSHKRGGHHSRHRGGCHRREQGETPCQGRVPNMRLRFGSFLYYSGIISMATLIDAMVWQKRQRPLLGTMAYERGWITRGDIRRILHARRPGELFGESARRCGCLDDDQISHLLRTQKLLQPRIGQYFVRHGILGPGDVERLLREMFLHNIRCNHRR
ncbi:MAG: J domain-containing protein [Syntrophales bacterium]|nr:J domain-containing protein [Syntrophales bacterium]